MNRILGVELSHKYAPISIREKVALNKEQTEKALKELKEHYEEAFIVSTCNRLSVYVYGNEFNYLIDFFNNLGISRQYLSIFPDTQIAIRNLFATAAGLESQAIGEHQILGQIRDALDLARKMKTIGPILDEFTRQAIHAGKRVRMETEIGKHSASLATVGFELIQNHGYDLANSTIMVIGTGNMANLITTILDRTGLKKLYVLSHDLPRAKKMAEKWGGEAVDLKDAHRILHESNIIIGGTQGEINLLHEQELPNSTCDRAQFGSENDGKMLLIDFGVPRNFNPHLKLHPGITLYDLDDIKKLTYEGLLKRYEEIPQAEDIVNTQVKDFYKWLNGRKVAPILSAYSDNLEQIKIEELNWLFPKMGNINEAQKQLIERFTYRLVRKISKAPIEGIRKISQNLHIQENPITTVKNILDVNDANIFVPQKKIVVGTRGSKLALTQTHYIIDKLRKIEPKYEFVTKVIKTSGDKGDISQLGSFTNAIERELLKGTIDMAVHSFKDLPVEDVKGLQISGVDIREDSRDALISRSGKKLDELPAGSIVGTGSLRRSIQLKQLRPDLEIKHIQGNVDTRLKKMNDGQYDAIVVAVAGIKRLDMLKLACQIFDFKEMLPAAGQGALAIETREKNDFISHLIESINHPETQIAVDMERVYLKALGGGCNYPIASYAQIEDGTIKMTGLFATDDGQYVSKGTICGSMDKYEQLAKKLARQLQDNVEKMKNEHVSEATSK